MFNGLKAEGIIIVNNYVSDVVRQLIPSNWNITIVEL